MRRAEQDGPDDDSRSGSGVALNRVNRQFKAPRPNALWVSDFTHVASWSGFVYVAFVIDDFARRIVGCRVSRTTHASFVLDALEQALHERRPLQGGGLVHGSDRGSRYLALRYTERLAEAGVEPSVGSVGDSSTLAYMQRRLAEGLTKREIIRCLTRFVAREIYAQLCGHRRAATTVAAPT